MEYSEIITTGPIVKDKDNEKEGYFYRIKEVWGGQFNGAENFYYWAIYTDGTCAKGYDSEAEGFWYDIKGTFDKSRYEMIVNQIENLATGWQEELHWDEDTMYAQWE